MTAFDLPSGSDNFEFCVKKSLERENKEKLIKCLAAHRVVPVKNQWDDTSFGKTIANFERRGDPKPRITNGMRRSMLKLLNINDEEAIEHLRRRIKNRPEWGDEA